MHLSPSTRTALTGILAAVAVSVGSALADVVRLTAPDGTVVTATMRQTNEVRVRNFKLTAVDGRAPDPAAERPLRAQVDRDTSFVLGVLAWRSAWRVRSWTGVFTRDVAYSLAPFRVFLVLLGLDRGT